LRCGGSRGQPKQQTDRSPVSAIRSADHERAKRPPVKVPAINPVKSVLAAG
jgi:hypothetical protein